MLRFLLLLLWLLLEMLRFLLLLLWLLLVLFTEKRGNQWRFPGQFAQFQGTELIQQLVQSNHVRLVDADLNDDVFGLISARCDMNGFRAERFFRAPSNWSSRTMS